MSEPEPEPIKRPEAKPPFQFGLRSLFIVTLVCAILCAIAAQFGTPGVIISVAASVVILGFWSRGTRPVTVVAAVLLLLVALILFLPGVGSGPPHKRAICTNNLKQIGLALHNYHNAYGCFPPAYIADESGRPMHSWRVLILPFMEQEVLYKQYNFDEPWNGPNNRKLADISMPAFRCPGDEEDHDNESLMTNYVVVVGPDTAWPGEKLTKIGDCADGAPNTILVVELRDSGIHWMAPRDLHVVQMAPGINLASGQGISSHHSGGVNVVFADTHYRFLSEDVSPETVRALLTRNGGEKLDPDEF